ncbi:MAG: hypothetical protein QOJ02_2128 [Acidobacteriota bacterium]|nr:hypothetical protein [Acidobacteriota bacterium]
MRVNLIEHQLFLNYPFDGAFEPLANAMHFAVVAAGLIPVCAKDLTSPDRPRLETIINAITSCHYSIHDFSKLKGEGAQFRTIQYANRNGDGSLPRITNSTAISPMCLLCCHPS